MCMKCEPRPAKAQSLASGSVLDSMALHECSRLMKSARRASFFLGMLPALWGSEAAANVHQHLANLAKFAF